MNGNQLTVLTKDLGLTTADRLPSVTKWNLRREGGEMIKNTAVAVLHEQGRAMLTNAALENLGALSALEQHLCQVAPCGADRYRHIVDAYALGAAQKIARW